MSQSSLYYTQHTTQSSLGHTGAGYFVLLLPMFLQEEFAEALALAPDSVFVNQMFSVIDREGKGYISFRDMIYALVVFSKGICSNWNVLLSTL